MDKEATEAIMAAISRMVIDVKKIHEVAINQGEAMVARHAFDIGLRLQFLYGLYLHGDNE